MTEASQTPYVRTTRDIRISVIPEFMENSSDILGGQFSFAYHISIENLGPETVQLLERHWKIFSAEIQIGEVVGPGVVGEQPILKEGQAFRYSSGAVIHDPHGYMEGTYSFKGMDGRIFDVVIPRFYLLYPQLIQ